MQPGYPQPSTAQSGYGGQGDSGTQRPPSSYGTPTAHPGYGAPPIGQASYGQQLPPYSNAYAGAYVQLPAAYSADGNDGANPTS